MQHGRLAVELRRDLARLERLLRNDPEDIFWDVLQGVVLKTVKYLSRV
jgi:transcriptional regulator with XRE-family HTH domain